MHIEQARVLQQALKAAIDKAEATGVTEVELDATLDAQLDSALAEAEAQRSKPQGD